MKHAVTNHGPAVRFLPADGSAPVEVPHTPPGANELEFTDLPADVVAAIGSQPAGLVRIRKVYTP